MVWFPAPQAKSRTRMPERMPAISMSVSVGADRPAENAFSHFAQPGAAFSQVLRSSDFVAVSTVLETGCSEVISFPADFAAPTVQTECTVTLGCVVDHLFGRIVDNDWCLEILELRPRAEDRLDCLFKGRAVRFLRRLDVLPEINATAAPGRFIEQKGFMNKVRVSLPHRHTSAIFGHSVGTAHSVRQAKQHDLRNHGRNLRNGEVFSLPLMSAGRNDLGCPLSANSGLRTLSFDAVLFVILGCRIKGRNRCRGTSVQG